MNFSDDPLADLLSDNSLDNDNFFETPGGGGAKKQPKSSRSKGKLEDLFGIKEETEADVLSPAGTATKATKPSAISTPRIVKQKPSLSMDDDDDDELGFDPKRPKSSGSGARRNLFDDLLVAAEPKRNVFDDQRPATAKPTMSRQSTDTTTDTSHLQSQTRPKTAAGPGRRSSASAQSLNLNADPLGLFGRERETNPTVSGMSTPVSKQRGTADWLGLSTAVEQESALEPEPVPEPVAEQLVAETQLERPGTPRTPVSSKQPSRLTISEDTELPRMRTVTDNTAQQILMLNNMNMESTQNYSALQQQETQLLIAAQMKSQERALLDMQRKQETQDRKFQALLQQQLQRQLQMEEHIKAQQERINVHLQLMMTQPVMANAEMAESLAAAIPAPVAVVEPAAAENREQLLQLETDVKRNMLEKLRLEELVANMKVNYEQEIEMIENSYKKQLKVLEQHLEAVEQRLKLENTELKDYYTGKLEQLKADYELQVSTLKQDHEDDLRQLRSANEADMERIRQAKIMEHATVRDHGNYLETLRLASNDLQELREGMNTNKEQQLQLEQRERRLADAERRLKLDTESAEQERQRLMELVGTLELQLSRLSKDSAEENWQMRQRLASLEAEKKAFEQEKLYHRQQMDRDEKRMEELKTMQLTEMERIQLDLQQERTRLLVEQQKLELQQKLHEQSDSDKERLELEAQLQVARDAIKRADEQRDRCHKQQRELEQRKRILLDKENALSVKEDEVVQASSAYRLAINRSHLAENKAREAEQLLHAKLQLLGKRAHELSEKEAQISQERMLLAQDRIALHKMKQQIGQSKCALCKMGVENVEFSQRMGNTAVTNELQPQPQRGNPTQAALPACDIVDRMLDENIDASYRRMYNLTGTADMDYWTTVGLDDDSKKMALHNTNALDIEDLVLTNLNLN